MMTHVRMTVTVIMGVETVVGMVTGDWVVMKVIVMDIHAQSVSMERLVVCCSFVSKLKKVKKVRPTIKLCSCLSRKKGYKDVDYVLVIKTDILEEICPIKFFIECFCK